MLKRIALPVLAAALLFATAAAPKASAAVRFGISIGAPAYVAPAPVPYYEPYAAPYVYAPAPVYRDYGWRDRGFRYRHYDRDRGFRR